MLASANQPQSELATRLNNGSLNRFTFGAWSEQLKSGLAYHPVPQGANRFPRDLELAHMKELDFRDGTASHFFHQLPRIRPLHLIAIRLPNQRTLLRRRSFVSSAFRVIATGFAVV